MATPSAASHPPVSSTHAIPAPPLPYRLEYGPTTAEKYVTSQMLCLSWRTASAREPGRGGADRKLTNGLTGEWHSVGQAEGGVARPPPGRGRAAERASGHPSRIQPTHA
ncbi:hypothetical protein Acsp03_64870 [Actinomadura sp. NBRC 104412]|nr:hypothetical protein Acsp03_64870 [Actinomadura sp. NBRC 104412]